MKSRIAKKIFKCCEEANNFFYLVCDLMKENTSKDNTIIQLKRFIERSKYTNVKIFPYYRHSSYQFTKAEHTIEKLQRKRMRKLGMIDKEIKDE